MVSRSRIAPLPELGESEGEIESESESESEEEESDAVKVVAVEKEEEEEKLDLDEGGTEVSETYSLILWFCAFTESSSSETALLPYFQCYTLT